MLLPLRTALVFVWQDDTVGTIADPIHELECREIKLVVRKMVLNKNKTAADPAGFEK